MVCIGIFVVVGDGATFEFVQFFSWGATDLLKFDRAVEVGFLGDGIME